MNQTDVAAATVESARKRTRAAQHVGSYPLLVIGVVLVNYGIIGFNDSPVAWRFAGALAFVVLWGLGKMNESEVGIGPARGDYLAIAAGVFTATQLTLVNRVLSALDFSQLQGLWVVIVGAGLIALGLSRHERALLAWGGLVVAVGAGLVVNDSTAFGGGLSNGRVEGIPTQVTAVVVLGVALTIAGLATYGRERRIA
jgi:hypothetical protein